uniref:Uncharacterized protein n=1 Tax=Anguilla anguilla TaxID=7936 RepID=A0A0E9X591_ANGAN
MYILYFCINAVAELLLFSFTKRGDNLNYYYNCFAHIDHVQVFLLWKNGTDVLTCSNTEKQSHFTSIVSFLVCRRPLLSLLFRPFFCLQ